MLLLNSSGNCKAIPRVSLKEEEHCSLGFRVVFAHILSSNTRELDEVGEVV